MITSTEISYMALKRGQNFFKNWSNMRFMMKHKPIALYITVLIVQVIALDLTASSALLNYLGILMSSSISPLTAS